MIASELSCYPYFDPKRHNAPTLDAHTMQAIARVEGPIIEVGGPTTIGYRMLGEMAVLPTVPIVTNLNQHGAVDMFADAKAMPLPDESVGMYLASNMSHTDFFGLASKGRSVVRVQKKQAERAQEEYEQALDDPTFRPTYNLRIALLQEMTRTLVPNGLILFEALNTADILVAKRLGHSVIQAQDRHGHYDCVLKKDGAIKPTTQS